MKSKILIGIVSIALLASCSSIYKNGQTPDDVYYSPVREGVKEETKRNEERVNTAEDDNYLRMRVRNQMRWRTIDDFSYWNDSRFNLGNCNNFYFNNNINNGWNSHFYNNGWNNNFYSFSNNNCNWNNSFLGWNSWGNNNGFWNNNCYVINYKNPSVYKGNTAASNITAYRNNKYSNTNYSYNPKLGNTSSNGNSLGGLFKRVFTPSTSSSPSSSYDRPARTFGSSSSSTTTTSSSAGGKSGGYNSTGSSSSGGRTGRN